MNSFFHCAKSIVFFIGLREYFSQTDERSGPPRIPIMVNMASASVTSMKTQKLHASSIHRSPSLDQINAANRNAVMMDEYSDDEDEFQMPDQEVCTILVLSLCLRTLFEFCLS